MTVQTYGVEPMSPAVFDALSLLTPYDIDLPKQRIGPSRDGGYTVAALDGKQDVISFGISNDVRFEKQLALNGHRCFMYDHTIGALPDQHPNFQWFRKGICGAGREEPDLMPLDQHLSTLRLSDRLLLKIDVEGAEWESFASMSEDTLCRFDQIVGEFHWLLDLPAQSYRETFVAALTNLNKHFTLFDVHANNCRKLGFVAGFAVADVLELSFVRTSLIQRRPSQTVYPTTLGSANNAAIHDHALFFYPFLPTSARPAQLKENVLRLDRDCTSP